MPPPDEIRVPDDGRLGPWGRLTQWATRNRPLAWLAGLTIGLVLFFIWLPPFVRTFFWNGLQAQAVLASMTLGFGLLALSLLWSVGQRLDSWAFLFFNLRGGRPRWLDLLATGFTQIGNGIAAGVLALILFLAGYRLLAYELILGVLTLWVVVELVKLLVRRRRPFLRLVEARVVGHREGGRSFPSGHTSQAFFIATLLVGYFALSLWAVSLLYLLAALVGVTRMYVGAHYPRDVVAGAILGSAWGLLAGLVFGYAL
jgi:membrane-associated phospholipid phosphatase